MGLDALDLLCTELTRDLFAIAKFLYLQAKLQTRSTKKYLASCRRGYR